MASGELVEYKEVKEEEPEQEVTVFAGDQLIEIARQADAVVSAMKTIIRAALAMTNEGDWSWQGNETQGYKLFLECSGSEKIGRAFGISWKIFEQPGEIFTDGHYLVSFEGEFTFKGKTITRIGSASSKDKFFWKQKAPIAPELVDKGNVRKKAYTNCIGNGIKTLLALKKITEEDLKVAGLEPSKINKVEFKSQTPQSAEEGGQAQELWTMLMEMNGGIEAQAKENLEAVTSFPSYKDKDGKKLDKPVQVAGVKDIKLLKGQRLSITYDKVKKMWAEGKK